MTSASYTTSAGTRTVTYSTASPWGVTYLSGSSLAHGVTYTTTDVYVSTSETDHYLTQITAASYTGLAGNAQETFVYDANYKVTEARLPDYASSVPDYNNSNTDAKVGFAYDGTSCTVTRWAAVRTAGTPTGATGTAITQVFDWNGHGTLDGRTNPKVSGTDEWWSYTYTDETSWLLSETSPLGKIRSWTYDGRGNILTQTDELGHVTSYTYPTSDADPNRDLPLTVTSPSGAVTTYTYDANGNVTYVERELNEDPTDNLAKTSYTYANVTVGSKTYYKALTQVQKLITGTTWATTDYNLGGYYANGAPAQVVNQDVLLQQGGTPVDLTVTSTYDAFGNLLTSTDPNGQVVPDQRLRHRRARDAEHLRSLHRHGERQPGHHAGGCAQHLRHLGAPDRHLSHLDRRHDGSQGQLADHGLRRLWAAQARSPADCGRPRCRLARCRAS